MGQVFFGEANKGTDAQPIQLLDGPWLGIVVDLWRSGDLLHTFICRTTFCMHDSVQCSKS